MDALCALVVQIHIDLLFEEVTPLFQSASCGWGGGLQKIKKIICFEKKIIFFRSKYFFERRQTIFEGLRQLKMPKESYKCCFLWCE